MSKLKQNWSEPIFVLSFIVLIIFIIDYQDS